MDHLSKAIFLDRDNTLIKDEGYFHNVEKLEYMTDVREALSLMQDKGFDLFVITNQSGIGRGLFNENDMKGVHAKIQADMLAWGLKPFVEFAWCPHTPEDECECRKPKPKLLNQLIEKYHINKEQSFMVGDKPSDADCGKNAGVTGVLITETTLLNFAKIL